jgi:hypothetical protein
MSVVCRVTPPLTFMPVGSLSMALELASSSKVPSLENGRCAVSTFCLPSIHRVCVQWPGEHMYGWCCGPLRWFGAHLPPALKTYIPCLRAQLWDDRGGDARIDAQLPHHHGVNNTPDQAVRSPRVPWPHLRQQFCSLDE